MTGLPSFFENFFYSLVYKRALSVLISESQIFRLGWPQSRSSHLNTRSVYDHESI